MFLISSLDVEFQHVGRLVNSFADSLAKQRMGRFLDLMAITIKSLLVFGGWSSRYNSSIHW